MMRGQMTAAFRPSYKALLPLLPLAIVDVVLIGLHVLAQIGDWYSPRWSIESDNGFAENWQYIKVVFIVLMLLHVAVRRASQDRMCCVAWALLFVWMLADDGLQLHERMGAVLASWLAPLLASGHLAQAIAEVIVMLVIALLLLGWIVWASASAGQRWRAWSLGLLGGLACLAFFAIAVDLVHALVRTPLLHAMLGLIEEGGEMLCLSAVLLLVAAIWSDRMPPWLPALERMTAHRLSALRGPG